jgi:hypothetical protein
VCVARTDHGVRLGAAMIAIIVGHSRPTTFCEALGKAYFKAAGGGHTANLLITANLTFEAILHVGFDTITTCGARTRPYSLSSSFHCGSAHCPQS